MSLADRDRKEKRPQKNRDEMESADLAIRRKGKERLAWPQDNRPEDIDGGPSTMLGFSWGDKVEERKGGRVNHRQKKKKKPQPPGKDPQGDLRRARNQARPTKTGGVGGKKGKSRKKKRKAS